MIDEQDLIAFVTARRWFGSKSREVVHARLIDSAILREADPRCAIELVELAFDSGLHETYQLLRLIDGDEPDGLANPALARELVHKMRGGVTLQAREGLLEFHPVEGFTGLGRELLTPRPIASEH